MDKKFIARLKEFYTLETFQVAFYQAQEDSAADEYYKKAFQKMIGVEQNHADFFAALIERTGEEVPSIMGPIFKLAGDFIGESVEQSGQHDTCVLGEKLENKAIEKYRAFIKESSENKYLEIRNTLMEFLLDEEFHALWLHNYAKNHLN